MLSCAFKDAFRWFCNPLSYRYLGEALPMPKNRTVKVCGLHADGHGIAQNKHDSGAKFGSYRASEAKSSSRLHQFLGWFVEW